MKSTIQHCYGKAHLQYPNDDHMEIKMANECIHERSYWTKVKSTVGLRPVFYKQTGQVNQDTVYWEKSIVPSIITVIVSATVFVLFSKTK